MPRATMNKEAFIHYWGKKRKLNKWGYLGSISLLFGIILTTLLAWFDDTYVFEPSWRSIHPYLTIRFGIFFIGWFVYKLFQWNKLERAYHQLINGQEDSD